VVIRIGVVGKRFLGGGAPGGFPARRPPLLLPRKGEETGEEREKNTPISPQATPLKNALCRAGSPHSLMGTSPSKNPRRRPRSGPPTGEGWAVGMTGMDAGRDNRRLPTGPPPQAAPGAGISASAHRFGLSCFFVKP